MLGFGRLFKYEFKAVGRVMLPLYGAMIVSSIIFGLTNLINSGNESGVLTFTSAILYGLTVMAVVAFTAVMLIQRFYKNLLGNEGYLNFTLPVSINAHIGNKTLSAGIWMILGAVAGMLSVFIILLFMVTPGEIARELGYIWSDIKLADSAAAAKLVLLIVECIVLAVVWCGEVAIKIYAAISLGQQWASHRVLGAVGAYIGFSIAESIVGGILQAVVPIDTPMDLMEGISDYAATQMMLLIILVSELILIGIYWVINNRLLEKHLNLQ